MSTDIRIAQAIGTVGCALAAGGISTLSWIGLPTLALPARFPSDPSVPGTPISHLTHQWLFLFKRGHDTFPTLATASSLANGYLAWTLRDAGASPIGGYSWTTCYVAAIAATMSIVPWTLILINNTNVKLTAHATRDDKGSAKELGTQETARRAKDDAEVPGLLRYWSMLNLVRSVFPLVGAVIGFTAAVSM
ncbi:hypothetical protein N7510_001894 [Penicillium lagena]|uniref:uncharacterized protein n=1 Tax=Penicillium lagena TaxID=94218 RepID=UPI002541281C|nr:uncharacterized protein N7510_001894 [Penicillium lagena]KAJ5625585.1 hypothetical protein N7510_001894 [Penicillium lagena]